MPSTERPPHILPLIILAQFLGTISWLAGNAILPDLQQQWLLTEQAVASLTNSVQIGFIIGALLFAILALADRISPQRLFMACTTLSACCSAAIAFWADNLNQLLILRFISGLMLAGIYPIGMKLAAGWFPQGLGRALGYLVGALVLGTATPHFASGLIQGQWQLVMILVALASFLSGLIIWLGVGNGPAHHSGSTLRWSALATALKHPPLRAAALGYFGHMWELYAVWAFAPLWLNRWAELNNVTINSALLTSAIIAIGALGCVVGGKMSVHKGSRQVARIMLFISALCCVLSPLMISAPLLLMLFFWLVWGFSVVADSPQLSTLSAQQAPASVVGSSLTLINCIGYTITLIAVELLATLLGTIPVEWLMLILAPGPIIGIISLNSKSLKNAENTT